MKCPDSFCNRKHPKYREFSRIMLDSSWISDIETKQHSEIEQWQLAGLISRRSQVRVLLSLLEATKMDGKKTLHNSDISGARKNVKDISIVGNGDSFSLLCKASSVGEGWMKSTKAMEIPGVGCVVQVTTQQENPDGSYAVAEALSFVPGVTIVEDENDGRKLVKA